MQGQGRVRPLYGVIYNFKGGTEDGSAPWGGLLNISDTLYGVTEVGGSGTCYSGAGCGTLYAVSTGGKERLIYSFKGGTGDGESPAGTLTTLNGKLYGATALGGAANVGTAFTATISTEGVINNFKAESKGGEPESGLVKSKVLFYGTTFSGGGIGCGKLHQFGCGTVFAMTSSGKETVLHRFGSKGDGKYPDGGLVDLNGTFYGTTVRGGAAPKKHQCGADGCGVIFAIAPSGEETVLHRFDWTDGAFPYASLISVNGTLYGTASKGGAHGFGTIFSITPAGKLTVLYSFGGIRHDGMNPLGSLLDVKGRLYGTTQYGGTKNVGTVFSITFSGKEALLHSFEGSPGDGAYPQSQFIDVNGMLYSTTIWGGNECHTSRGCGTVFAISP